MILTRKMIDAGMSRKGSWSRAQMELIGVQWPPRSGWPSRVVGMPISETAYAEFLSLKDAHLPQEQAGLFPEDANHA